MRFDSTSTPNQHRNRQSTNGSSHHHASFSGTNGSAETETNGSNGSNGYHTNGHSITNTAPYHGHDREEVTRILMQTLSDLGYSHAAKLLSDESGYALEIPTVAAFRNAVLQGEWDEAELLLLGSEESDGGVALGKRHSRSLSASHNGFAENGYAQHEGIRHGLPLATGMDTTLLKFSLRQQKYLELLEKRELNAALNVLRNELTPLKRDIGRLHTLSSFIMCQSAEDLRLQADWDGAEGDSRSALLSKLSKSISPSVMIPEHRLATLLASVQREQILSCRYHNTTVQPSLYTNHECSIDDFPLQTLTELRTHADEVWFVQFSHDGTMLATGGKDGLVCIYDTTRWRIRHEFREHERQPNAPRDRGVCCVAFSPDDQYLISCSQNNEFVVVNVHDGRCVARADHFDYPVTSAAWLPDSLSFVIGTQGSRRPLGLYSLRSNTSSSSSSSSNVIKNNEIYSWRDPPWDSTLKDNPNSFRITDCAINADGTRLVAATIDNRLLIYDLRSRAKIIEWTMEDKLTSVNFSSDGTELLVNMNKGKVVVLDLLTGQVIMRYEGAIQEAFVIRSCFGGAGESFVVSGSEDSRAYIWRRQTGVQVVALEAHASGTVNSVAWHPTNPGIFASAGDDRKVRIWAAASAMRLSSVDTAGPGASRTSLGSHPQ